MTRTTAELLVASPFEQRTPAASEWMRQIAAATVGHPDGRALRVLPVDGGVEVRTEGRHDLPARGVGAQNVRITAGAAVLNLRLAIAATGHRPVVRLLPVPSQSALLAVLRRGADAEATPLERALFRGVGRFLPPVGDRGAPDPVLHRARAAAAAEGVWLRTLDGPERALLADRIRPVREQASDVALMAVGGNHDVPATHLRAGMALQRIVLTARLHGATAAVVAWPADLAAARPLPRSLGDHGLYPQLIVAIGRPSAGEGDR